MNVEPSDRDSSRASAFPWLPLLVLAAALTLLNAVKPLHVDDPFIYEIARQILAHPLDPYGFDIFWLQWPQPVHEELTPPVLPYWWALLLRLGGASEVVWKLGLFPFAALLAVSLFGLLRRFARPLALPLVALSLLSPAFLPGFNLMQDLPAQSLGLAALALYLFASDRERLSAAVGSGVLLGLATQTKYTTVSILALVVVHSLLRRRLRPAAIVVLVALAIFGGWEIWTTVQYGQGMFLGQVHHGMFWYPRWKMIWPMVTLLGGIAPALVPLALGAIGAGRHLVRAAAALILAGFALLLWLPAETVLFSVLGSLVALATLLCVAGTLRLGVPGATRPGFLVRRRIDLLLAVWLLTEVSVYFATSPFPATRRILGIVVVSTLIVGRLAALALRLHGRHGAVAPTLLLGATLGLGFFLVDLRGADAHVEAVQRASTAIRESAPQGRIWYVGHWGFQYYAERAGMQAVVPDVSRLERGDWLVVPDEVDRQEIVLDPTELESAATLEIDAFPPLRTEPGYYAGGLPLAHRAGPRLRVTLYRVRRSFGARTSWPTARLVDWAVRSTGRTAAAAVPALIPRLRFDDLTGRRTSALALAEIGALAEPATEALTGALFDPDPAVRYWAVVALGRIGPPATAAVPRLRRLEQEASKELREAAREALQAIEE